MMVSFMARRNSEAPNIKLSVAHEKPNTIGMLSLVFASNDQIYFFNEVNEVP